MDKQLQDARAAARAAGDRIHAAANALVEDYPISPKASGEDDGSNSHNEEFRKHLLEGRHLGEGFLAGVRAATA